MTERGRRADDRSAFLARSFVWLADTLVDDYDVVDFLNRLAALCVEMFEVHSAGLLVLDQTGSLQPLASSSESTHLLELFQLQNDEGPCLDCVRTGQAVNVPDLKAVTSIWPRFTGAAAALGLRSMCAVPMRLRQETIGSLNVFSVDEPLRTEDQVVAQALADVATIGILQERGRDRAAQLAAQLQSALDTRIVVEQGKGILAEYAGVPMDVAFEALRRHARSSQTKVGEAAAALVNGELPPSSVLPQAETPGG